MTDLLNKIKAHVEHWKDVNKYDCPFDYHGLRHIINSQAQGVYKITEQFEKKLSEYTGAPYVVCVDNCSNALFLCLKWWQQSVNVYGNFRPDIHIPSRTYMSVPCSIIQAGHKVVFKQIIGTTLKSSYQLYPTPIWDCALRFTKGMYKAGQFQCLSFTGPRKHLKLSKGGAILTDDKDAYEWFKKARFSGRGECDYADDNFTMLGYNFYMMPEIAARGLLLMQAFPDDNEDLEIPYPDLSKFKIYTDVS